MKDPFDNSPRWYLGYLNSVPAALFRTTIEGQIVYCNRRYAQIFGFENAGDLVGFPVINLYRHKKDRGLVIQSIMQRGGVNELPVPFLKQDGSPIWCGVTARAVLDDDGSVVLLDGILKEITDEIEEGSDLSTLDGPLPTTDDLIFIFDLQGVILDINPAGSRLLGYRQEELRGRPMAEFLSNVHQELFMLFLSDILKFGSEQVVLSIVARDGKEHLVDCHGLLARKEGRAQHVKALARDVTLRTDRQRATADEEKLQGVMEMAGGVAHRLNQPLTIVHNLLNEITVKKQPHDVDYEKFMTVQHQIDKMIEITRKISNIRKYAAMDYVAGIKIVDIDRAS